MSRAKKPRIRKVVAGLATVAVTFRLRRGMVRVVGAAAGDGPARETPLKDYPRLLAADMKRGPPNEAGHWAKSTIMNGQMNSHRLWS